MGLKVRIFGLKKLQAKFEDPAVKAGVLELAKKPTTVAIVSQAIADNFEKEGPGWPALKAKTIRQSVKGKTKKAVAQMTDKELLKHEKKARSRFFKSKNPEPYRKILQRTGLLKKLATTPGASGTSSGKSKTVGYSKIPKKGVKTVSGRNIFKVEGTNLIWGVDLIYAKTHNKGDNERGIPKREYLILRPYWKKQLNSYILKETIKLVKKSLRAGT